MRIIAIFILLNKLFNNKFFIIMIVYKQICILAL